MTSKLNEILICFNDDGSVRGGSVRLKDGDRYIGPFPIEISEDQQLVSGTPELAILLSDVLGQTLVQAISDINQLNQRLETLLDD